MHEQTTDRTEGRGLQFGCGSSGIVATVVVVLVVLVMVFILLRLPSGYASGQQQLRADRAEALQPWDIGLGIALRLLLCIAGLALVLGLVAAVRALVRWLDTRSRLIHPDPETGQFPAVKVSRGESVVDLNRTPDGKIQTAVMSGKMALLLGLILRHWLGRDVPELTTQPNIVVTPPDTSPEQLQVTTQHQAAQALAAASRGGNPRQVAGAVQMLAPSPARPPQRLPPLLVRDTAPQEVKLLMDAAWQEWEQGAEGGSK